jgi:hypothetical protein
MVMGCHNLKDETLIKRRRTSQKMNAIGGEVQGQKVTVET